MSIIRVLTKRQPPTPSIRQQKLDWKALTEQEQTAILKYLDEALEFDDLSERARVYVRRHQVTR